MGWGGVKGIPAVDDQAGLLPPVLQNSKAQKQQTTDNLAGKRPVEGQATSNEEVCVCAVCGVIES
jgi:hypothetical protein